LYSNRQKFQTKEMRKRSKNIQINVTAQKIRNFLDLEFSLLQNKPVTLNPLFLLEMFLKTVFRNVHKRQFRQILFNYFNIIKFASLPKFFRIIFFRGFFNKNGAQN